jgi:hypothetical protein
MHPSFIYYLCHVKNCINTVKALDDETEELIKLLDAKYKIDEDSLKADGKKANKPAADKSKPENQPENQPDVKPEDNKPEKGSKPQKKTAAIAGTGNYTESDHSFNIQLIHHMERSRAMINEKLDSNIDSEVKFREIHDLNNLMQNDLIYLKRALDNLSK